MRVAGENLCKHMQAAMILCTSEHIDLILSLFDAAASFLPGTESDCKHSQGSAISGAGSDLPGGQRVWHRSLTLCQI